MGLPIWRDPDEVKIKKEKAESKPDPTAPARSPIRRRPPQYARRSNPPHRHPLPPRFERSDPPSQGLNGSRGSRRNERRGVPPVSTLLEHADSRPTPPAAPEASRPGPSLGALNVRGRELRDSITQLQNRAHRLEREAQNIQTGLLPSDWEARTEQERDSWLEDNSVPRYLVPQQGRTSVMDALQDRLNRARPQSRDGPRRSTLPTPPYDESGDPDSLFLPPGSPNAVRRPRVYRTTHPLSRSWRPESPVNGLGDRNRSPTPTDGWEIMRTTIAPDETLPSADSSFTSAAASQSFTSGSTNATERNTNASSENSRRNSQDDDVSVSSIDADDLVCSDEERQATAAFAEHMYYREENSPEGRERISRQFDNIVREGNRYALFDEGEHHEIGFRLIDQALQSSEGRQRVFQLTQSLPVDIRNNFEQWIFGSRPEGSRRTRSPHITDDEPPSPHPERYGSNARAAVREASEQVHDYFRRITADEALTASRNATTSPPPRYEPLASHPAVNTFTSRDGAEASRPASPPSARSERDVSDALLSGDEQDLSAIRRVVERLAQRDDVPDEWWMSMGLNLSRTRARSRSRSPARADAGGRVRSGRVERERGSRL